MKVQYSRVQSLLNGFVIHTSFQANIGQDEDFDEARLKAEKLGAKKVGEELYNCNYQHSW